MATTTSANTLLVMYIGIGEFEDEDDRSKHMQKDMDRLRHQIQPIDNVCLIQSLQRSQSQKQQTQSQKQQTQSSQKQKQSQKQQTKATHWTGREVIHELEYFRDQIILGQYDGYLLLIVSHGNDKGNGKYVITSDGTKIKYSTIQNALRNAEDIPPNHQTNQRMGIIYTCGGPYRIRARNNCNNNNTSNYHSEGNNYQLFLEAKYDQHFSNPGIPSQQDDRYAPVTSNCYLIEPSKSGRQVVSFGKYGSPPVMSLCNYLYENMGKSLDFFSSFKTRVIHDMVDLHKYPPDDAWSLAIDPDVSGWMSAQKRYTFSYKKPLESQEQNKMKKLKKVFTEMNHKKNTFNQQKQQTNKFLNERLNDYFMEFGTMKLFQSLSHHRREVSLVDFVQYFNDPQCDNSWITIENIRLIKDEIEEAIDETIPTADKPNPHFSNDSIDAVIFEKVNNIASRLKRLSMNPRIRDLVSDGKITFMPCALESILDYNIEYDEDFRYHKILYDFHQNYHDTNDKILILCAVDKDSFCGFITAERVEDDDEELFFRCILSDIIGDTNDDIDSLTYDIDHEVDQATNNIKKYMQNINEANIEDSEKLLLYQRIGELNQNNLQLQMDYINAHRDKFIPYYNKHFIGGVNNKYKQCMDNDVIKIDFDMYIYRKLDSIYPFVRLFVEKKLLLLIKNEGGKSCRQLQKDMVDLIKAKKKESISIVINIGDDVEISVYTFINSDPNNSKKKKLNTTTLDFETISQYLANTEPIILYQYLCFYIIDKNKKQFEVITKNGCKTIQNHHHKQNNKNNNSNNNNKQHQQLSYLPFPASNSSNNKNKNENKNKTNQQPTESNNNGGDVMGDTTNNLYNNDNDNDNDYDMQEKKNYRAKRKTHTPIHSNKNINNYNKSNGKNGRKRHYNAMINDNNSGDMSQDEDDDSDSDDDDSDSDSDDDNDNTNNEPPNKKQKLNVSITTITLSSNYEDDWWKKVKLHENNSDHKSDIRNAISGPNGINAMAMEMKRKVMIKYPKLKANDLFNVGKKELYIHAGFYLLASYIQDHPILKKFNIDCWTKKNSKNRNWGKTLGRIPKWEDSWDKSTLRGSQRCWSFRSRDRKTNKWKTFYFGSFSAYCEGIAGHANVYYCLICLYCHKKWEKSLNCSHNY